MTTAHAGRQTSLQGAPTAVDRREAAAGSARPAVARDFVPAAAAAGLVGVGALALSRADPPAAPKAARFLNLLLASLLAGNGLGSERFVHPALRALPPRAYLEAEQAITRRYPGTMLALMPAAPLGPVQPPAHAARGRRLEPALPRDPVGHEGGR
jgi:hypothetical protein